MKTRSRRPAVFDGDLHVKIPTDVRQLLDAEALRRRCRLGELTRQLLFAGIASEGLNLPEPTRA